MKKLFVVLIAFSACSGPRQARVASSEVPSVIIDQVIATAETERIEKILAADDMQGRKPNTPGIEKAAAFIADEFKKAGLQPMQGQANYLQTFTMVRPNFVSAAAELDGVAIESKDVIVFTTKPSVAITEKSGFEIVKVSATDTLLSRVYPLIRGTKNVVVFVDTANARSFRNLVRLKRETFPVDRVVAFVLTTKSPSQFSIRAEHTINEVRLSNVVGVIPGKTRKNEYVLFSAHYDHLGTGRPNKDMDSIFNGANDDASGTTAVIMLANYFSKLKNNERTLVFAAFTAEESGGFGSQYFSKQFDPASVMAMFNIEMIGTESKWGANSAFITGYEKTDMGTILERNLQGSKFKFYPDPYPQQQLFYRSDNATLARLGVPAHTISTSKMDSEKYYHTLDDEIETLNMANMTEIIKAIAVSATSIVAGKDTPSRVNTADLR